MKFVLYTDYKANNNKSYNFEVLEATTLEEAIAEADAKMNDSVYLLQIMKKVGRTVKVEGGYKQETYEAILCRRSNGWHLNNKDNCEAEHSVYRLIGKYGDDFTYYGC